jgi:glycosyltransferase involved in cell wall biosynthesis
MVGGMESFVVRLASEQIHAGHEVAILALRPGPLVDTARSAGIRCIVPGARHAVTRAIESAYRFALLRPQIIHAHNETSLHYAVLGKSITGARLVVTEHGVPQSATRCASAHEQRATDAVVAVSGATASLLAGRWGRGPIVIHNGIQPPDTTPREEARRRVGAESGRVVGACVARIDGHKGHDDLLRAMAIMPASTPVDLLIVGDGVERGNMERLAADLGLGSRVRFLGYRSDVDVILAAADFFVLPSLSEGMPMSILEAMAAGLPVVATAVGGVEEVVEHGRHGLIVPPGSPDELREAIMELAADEALRARLGAAARNRALGDFSMSRMVDRYEALYRDLLFPRVAIRAANPAEATPAIVRGDRRRIAT